MLFRVVPELPGAGAVAEVAELVATEPAVTAELLWPDRFRLYDGHNLEYDI
jgi:hypothetical protein